jgi:hypothetical protein
MESLECLINCPICAEKCHLDGASAEIESVVVLKVNMKDIFITNYSHLWSVLSWRIRPWSDSLHNMLLNFDSWSPLKNQFKRIRKMKVKAPFNLNGTWIEMKDIIQMMSEGQHGSSLFIVFVNYFPGK